ncbi:hypothetical protein HS125_01090 [bacterium]|nr:hypothetical protein [bacterium]
MRTLWLLPLGCLLACPCPADIIYFKSGGMLHGRIISDSSDRVEFDLLGGARYSCVRDYVARVELETDFDFYLKDGDYYLSKGRDELAIRSYKLALKERPEDAVAQGRLELVEFNRRLRRAEAAIAEAERFLRADQFQKALAHYETALTLSPSDQMTREILDGMTLIYSRIAFAYYNHCFYEQAFEQLSRAEQINASRDTLSPKCAEIYYLLARIEEDRGDLFAAKRQLEYALQLDPNHEPARVKLGEVIRAIRKETS